MHWCPFWYGRGRIGGVFGFLSLWGDVFALRCMTPPSPYTVVYCRGLGIALGISRNGLGFYLESDRDGAFFGFLSSDGVVFTCGCMTPPPFFGGVLGFLFLGGVSDSLNSDIFSYFFVLLCIFSIYLGYGCAVVVRRRQVRIFMNWFFVGSNPPHARKSLRC